jgi:uncharacterized membrane protein YoaK (UPF0700 family)
VTMQRIKGGHTVSNRWRAIIRAGGISVHTTYLTGMITDLLRTEAERHTSAALSRASAPDPQRSILCGIWLAFVLGATIGAAMVFRLEALAIVGAALLLLATLICESVALSRHRRQN